MPYIVTVLVVILFYLVIVASDESRRNEKQHKEGIIRKIGILTRLSFKLAKKEAEIIKLHEENRKLIDESDEFFYFKIKTASFLKDITAHSLAIQAINELNILEYDKKQRINSASKVIERQCLDFIVKNELDSSKTNLVHTKY